MAAPQDPPARQPQGGEPPTEKLHDHAIAAEKHAEALATGLGQVGADAAAIKAVSQCADLMRQIASALAKGMKDEEPPPEAAPPATMDEAADQMMAERRAK